MGIQQALLSIPSASFVVALDANATAGTHNTSGVTGLDNGNLTVGAGLNRVLIVQLAFVADTGLPTGTTVKWDPVGANQSLTQIVSIDGGNYRASLWGLVNPTSGNKIIRAAWGGNTAYPAMNGTCFTGANQTGGATTFARSASTSGNSGAASLNVTSLTGNIAVDAVCSADVLSAPTRTQLVNEGFVNLGSSRASGAGSAISFGWTIASAVDWAQVGCDIVAG